MESRYRKDRKREQCTAVPDEAWGRVTNPSAAGAKGMCDPHQHKVNKNWGGGG